MHPMLPQMIRGPHKLGIVVSGSCLMCYFYNITRLFITAFPSPPAPPPPLCPLRRFLPRTLPPKHYCLILAS